MASIRLSGCAESHKMVLRAGEQKLNGKISLQLACQGHFWGKGNVCRARPRVTALPHGPAQQTLLQTENAESGERRKNQHPFSNAGLEQLRVPRNAQHARPLTRPAAGAGPPPFPRGGGGAGPRRGTRWRRRKRERCLRRRSDWSDSWRPSRRPAWRACGRWRVCSGRRSPGSVEEGPPAATCAGGGSSGRAAGPGWSPRLRAMFVVCRDVRSWARGARLCWRYC